MATKAELEVQIAEMEKQITALEAAKGAANVQNYGVGAVLKVTDVGTVALDAQALAEMVGKTGIDVEDVAEVIGLVEWNNAVAAYSLDHDVEAFDESIDVVDEEGVSEPATRFRLCDLDEDGNPGGEFGMSETDEIKAVLYMLATAAENNGDETGDDALASIIALNGKVEMLEADVRRITVERDDARHKLGQAGALHGLIDNLPSAV